MCTKTSDGNSIRIEGIVVVGVVGVVVGVVVEEEEEEEDVADKETPPRDAK